MWDSTAAFQTTDTAFNLAAGNYSVRITDSLNCAFFTSVTVNEPGTAILLVTGSSHVSCYGGNDGFTYVTASGGTPPYTYLWDSSAAFQTNDTAFNLSVGSYQVQVSDISGSA